MPAHRVTIIEVAAAAGVSRQTVTRAMNDMADISPVTRERVLDAAQRLGYRPSRFASNLAAREKHRTVGVVIESLRNPYYTDLAADIMDVCAERGWQTTITTTSGQDLAQLVHRLAMQVDAIVGYLPLPDPILSSAAAGLPVVQIDTDKPTERSHVIDLDLAEGMRRLIDEARERGARRFAMIDSAGAPSSQGTSRCRLLRNIVELEHVEESLSTLEDAARAVQRLRECAPDVDTVITFNDLMGVGAIVGAHQAGVAVPTDLRIIGIDGITLGALMDPPLSTLAIDRLAVARAAADLIEADFNGSTGARRVSIASRPIWRTSA